MSPDDLERRLVEAGREVVRPAAAAPRASAVIAEGRRRRTRRLQLTTIAGVAGAAMLVAVPIVSARDDRSPTRLLSVPPATTAVLIGDGSAATTTEPRSTPTTVPANVTQPTNAPVPTAPSTTSPPPPPTSTTSPSRNPETDGVDAGIWVVGLDGIGLRKISTPGAFPSWSPAGDRVALAVENWIWKLPTEPGRPASTVMSGSDRYPLCMDWASTGDLAWVTHRGQLIVAADGESLGRTLGTTFANVEGCRWSPDGTRLVLRRHASISVVDREGRVVRDWPLVAPAPEAYATSWVEWSPDGTRVAVLGRPAADQDDRNAGLHVLDLEADVDDALVPVFRPEAPYTARHVSWNRSDPDEVFVQVGQDSGASQHVVDVVARQARALTPRVCCQRLDSLVDGRFLAFGPTAKNGYRKELLVLGADRTVSRRLAFGTRVGADVPDIAAHCNGSYFTDKRVSPDGSKVAFAVGAAYGPRCDSPAW